MKIIESNDFQDDYSLNDLVQGASKLKVTDSSAANKTSNKELQQVLAEIAKDRKSSKSEAFAALAILAQMGATSSRTQGGVNVTIKDTTYTVDLIKKVIKKITGKSFRRVAKTFATEFKAVAQSAKYKGNLYNKIKLHYPDFTISEDEKFWLSDFQSENENCPVRIREKLNEYYKDFVEIKRK